MVFASRLSVLMCRFGGSVALNFAGDGERENIPIQCQLPEIFPGFGKKLQAMRKQGLGVTLVRLSERMFILGDAALSVARRRVASTKVTQDNCNTMLHWEPSHLNGDFCIIPSKTAVPRSSNRATLFSSLASRPSLAKVIPQNQGAGHVD
jgi:hypothetical protein